MQYAAETIQATKEKINPLHMHQVVPDVISTVPGRQVTVEYESAFVDFGNVLTPTQVKDKPKVSWTAEPNRFYTLIMTDPDAPSRETPKNREWQHWIVVNIPGGDVSKGETLVDYVGAGPPKGTGRHRYVFVVYQQPGKLQFNERKLDNHSGAGRGKFHASKFADKYNLGAPIGANFFLAEWDDHVPNLFQRVKAPEPLRTVVEVAKAW